MTRIQAGRLALWVAILSTIGSATPLHAQVGFGTWVRESGVPLPGTMTMTVEPCCNGGRRLIYRMTGADVAMTVESPFDGSDVPVMVAGKPSGQTMGIKRVDDHHTVTVLKMNGKMYGISKAAVSADGKTLTVENEFTSAAGGQPVGKNTEKWVRK